MADTTEFEAMEKDGWSNPVTAQSYADGFATATRVVAKVIADRVKAAEGTQVLDLCCGHGVVTAELIARGASVTGLDFSDAMITLARKNVPSAKFVMGDALDTGFPDQHFDAVAIGFGVPHFPDHARGLDEAARILKPGGRIAFSIWYGGGSWGAIGWIFDAVARFGDPNISLPEGPDAHALVESSIAEPLMTNAGFTNFKLESLDTQMLVPTPEELFDIIDKGSVRAASLLKRQSTERRDAIRQYLADLVQSEGIKHEEGYLVPTPSVVISAVRR